MRLQHVCCLAILVGASNAQLDQIFKNFQGTFSTLLGGGKNGLPSADNAQSSLSSICKPIMRDLQIAIIQVSATKEHRLTYSSHRATNCKHLRQQSRSYHGIGATGPY